MKSNNVKIFPFAPGIPWKLNKGKYVLPEVPAGTLNNLLKDKEVIVTAFGSLVESFISLSVLEAFNLHFPSNKLYWNGDFKYSSLAIYNGLATPVQAIDREKLEKYPTPIFLDKDEHYVFFNLLNNYRDVFTYYGSHGYKDRRTIAKQIFEKSMIDWDIQLVPKLRTLSEMPKELESWSKINKFYYNAPYVTIIPERSGLSEHSENCLNWSTQDIKAFAAMLYQSGIQLLIFTAYPQRYYENNIYCLPINLHYILYFLQHCIATLSNEVDFLIISNYLSDGRIISLPQRNEFKLQKLNSFLGDKNQIHTPRILSPREAFDFIKGSE